MTPVEKIAALRSHLEATNLDGLIIPHTDRHRHEFLPPDSQDLAWLTGFDGSAGLGIVLKDRAAVFVDGRYTLQARNQVDPTLYDIVPFTWSHIKDWIKLYAPKKASLGVDAWRISLDEHTRFKKVLDSIAGQCVFIEERAPMDLLWKDRPTPTENPLWIHPLQYAGISTKEKLASLCKGLQEQALDCAVLTVGDSLCWLLNLRGQDVAFTPLIDGFVIVYKEGYFNFFINTSKIASKVSTYITQQGGHIFPYETFTIALKELGKQKKRVLLDPTTSPYACKLLLEKSGAQVVAEQDPCTLPKAKKNITEIQGSIDAHIQDGLALTSFLAWLDTNIIKEQSVTELQASDYLLKERMKRPGFKEMSFETIAGSGPNGAIVHYRATPQTNRTLKLGELFLIDSGGQYSNGTTDVTRTIFLGSAPSAQQKEHFTRVLKGHIALAKAHFPYGTSGHQLDALARIALWEAGLDYAHGTGHGVGSFLSVHEGPQSISSAPRHVPLELGMIVSNEPGYYLEDHYGIRIESLQFVKKSHHKNGLSPFYTFEMLTLAPIDNTLIDINLLTQDESEWLSTYHNRVWQTLSPHLEENIRSWLWHKTRPL